MTSMNPAQLRVLELLRKPRDPLSPVREDLGVSLLAELEDALAGSVAHLGGERMHVNKHLLASVHTCERFTLGTRDGFTWSARTARGSVAHKAVQLGVNWRGEPRAPDLVDEALGRLVDGDDSLAGYLAGMSEADRAELRSEAVNMVNAFHECFPPLQASWKPSTETAVRVDAFGGLLRLHGRIDLALGGPTGLVPGKVLIDLKTGVSAAQHRDDLRFYALLETIRLGVPPRLVATCYLDSGRVDCEKVNESVLDASLARTVDGVRKLTEIQHAVRAATVSTGPACGWCPLRPDCSEGRAWITEREGRS
jgi:hypothetical protein